MTWVQTEHREGVAVVTINRPEKRNALSAALIDELHETAAVLEQDRRTAAVVVHGAGGNFVAGADIGELNQRGLEDALASINGTLMQRWASLPMPTIAAVEGYALGGGCELALACDLRVAGESAVLGQPEVGLGIIPGAGATYRLPELVGVGVARDLIFTGRLVKAPEALSLGLVNRVVGDDRVLEEALSLAERIAKQGRDAVRLAKLALAAGREGHPGSALERLAQGILFESPEKRRRMEAFLSRRDRGEKQS